MTAIPPRRRGYRWLAALPALFMLGGLPLANRTEPFVLGLPFLLFWILVWVVATSGVMALIYRLDERREGEERSPAALAEGDVARDGPPDVGGRP